MSNPLLDALHETSAYPWPAEEVEFIETHISWVFLAGERVVKLKRPIQFSFVDYSTLELRRKACEAEVRLNRLLSDDIYLDVVPIVQTGEGLRVAGEGEVVEWATLMRRIDEDAMLDSRLAEGHIPDDLAQRLADRLVPFHLEAAAPCEGPGEDVLATQESVLRDNLDELTPFMNAPLPGMEFVLVRDAMERFLKEHRSAMLDRIAGGWIREGHGDLRCEHIVVPDTGPVQVYDCVEFNRDLRCADIASDLAFLLMDLARLRAPAGTISDLLQRYDTAGADLPPGMLRLYWIHRALVRAKVHCLQYGEADPEQRPGLAAQAVDYLHLAARQALTARPVLIVMTGLSGTGKSTVADALARMIGIPRIVSDEVRKSIAANVSATEDIYSDEWTTRTYRELYRRAAQEMEAGKAVILDATFLDDRRRGEAASLASHEGVPFAIVETVTDEDVVERRLDERSRRGASISDATVDIYRQQRERLRVSPPGIPEGAIHTIVDTTPEGPASLDSVLSALLDAGIIDVRIDDVSPIEE